MSPKQSRSLGWFAALSPFLGAALLAACGDDATSPAGGGDAGGGGSEPAGAGPAGGSAADGGGGAEPAGGSGTGGSGGSFEGVDPIAGIDAVTLIQGGFQFTEGPVWLADLGVLRFSDIPATDILELDPVSGQISVWRADSQGTNGNAVAPDGDMVMCEHLGRRVSRSPADTAPAPVEVAGEYQGARFNSPNDVIVRSDGNIYFTDPTYGLGNDPAELDFRGVFRFDGTSVTLIDDSFGQPNGIALSPDETKLYVSDSQNGGLRVYDVASDGSVGAGSELIDAAPSDGMAVDDAGNLYLTTSDGVEVYKADGTPWGVIPVPEQPANCTFGGANRRTLFITARTGLYRVDINVPGRP
ncbi:MAG: SMP-30/gluconolactonase/LRE family protein [Myxococcales bacterium]|nr:SMP-30/gluconolactonase/LRE family protein [Myxococcales bacterium]